MRDGSVLAVGKGNPEWNYSAPHGAGRLMSGTKAKANTLRLLSSAKPGRNDCWVLALWQKFFGRAVL